MPLVDSGSMRATLAAATFVLLTSFFAGCVAPSDAASDASPSPAQTLDAGPAAAPAQFDETTGGVDGQVTDESLAPLPGASVALSELPDLIAITDVEGKFSFNHIPPGDYHLFAQKLGYNSVGRLVTVVAGSATDLSVVLDVIPIVEAYMEVKVQQGMFGCGVTLRPVVGVSVCGAFSLFLNNTDYDHFLLIWSLSGRPPEWQTGVLEMQWQTNQVAGRALSAIWEINGCPNAGKETFGRSTSGSPVRVFVNATKLQDTMKNAAKNDGCSGAAAQCDNELKCKMQTRVFSAAELLGPTSPADVGATFQQRFTQYESEFFNDVAPEDYTALKDT